MGFISGLLKLVGLGFLGDAAESIGADSLLGNAASGFVKNKAKDYAKGKAKGYISKKVSNIKSKHKGPDKTDKYWYLKDDD